MLKAKDTTRKCSPRKKKVSRTKSQIFCEISVEEKNGHDLGSFSKNSAVLGGGQGIFGDLEASRSRT